MMTPSSSPVLVREICLPPNGDVVQTFAHSLCSDADGNLYISDEFNHRVLSISAEGVLRWSIGGKGSEPGKFHYPRGLSLGRIQSGAEALPCLAVCDSWNRRIQFISLSGKVASIWKEVGGNSFKEPNGICYSCGSEGEDSWLILDKGGHCLIVASLSGQLLFNLGSELIPSREGLWRCWRPPVIKGRLAGDIVYTDPAFDPIHFPERVIGHAGGPIFITEPLTGTLKQIVLGNLVPVWKSPCHAVAVTADEWGVAMYDFHRSRISFWDAYGIMQFETHICGHPVFSDLPSREYWLQTNGKIQHWKCAVDEKAEKQPYAIMVHSVAADLNALSVSPLASSIQNVVQAAENIITLANDSIAAIGNDSRAGDVLDWFTERMLPRELDLQHAASQMLSLTWPAYLACLKLHLLKRLPSCINETLAKSLENQVCALFLPIGDILTQGMEVRDTIAMMAKSTPVTSPDYEDLRAALWRIYSLLESPLIQLGQACGNGLIPLVRCSAPPRNVGTSEPRMEESLGIPPVADRMITGSFLQEIDRISVEIAKEDLPSRPWGMTADARGHVFTSLFQASRILEMDSNGHVCSYTDPSRVMLSGPLGICLDSMNRIWIADSFSKSVKVLNPENTNSLACIPCSVDSSPPGTPVGVCFFEDRILVSEVSMQRIFTISLSYQMEIFCQKFGRGPGEFRDPCYLSPFHVRSHSSILVVDHHNHRIQELDSAGRFLRQVGRCGLGQGRLALPVSVTQLDAETIIIAQNHPFPALKVCSIFGQELDMFVLDYEPGGLLIQSGHLWVADHSGSSIRIYSLCGSMRD